tara:strand:- start:1 stop:291 length:291 start_codon:yes stop_codon:yes gene_type:complete
LLHDKKLLKGKRFLLQKMRYFLVLKRKLIAKNLGSPKLAARTIIRRGIMRIDEAYRYRFNLSSTSKVIPFELGGFAKLAFNNLIPYKTKKIVKIKK